MDSAYIALIVIGVIIGLAIIGLLVYWSMKNARMEEEERETKSRPNANVRVSRQPYVVLSGTGHHDPSSHRFTVSPYSSDS